MTVRAEHAPRLGVLDGLRGIAIALVVWYHVWQITWLRADVGVFGHTLNFNAIAETGFIGVDLFFFVSGFCLFYPYARSRFDGRPRQSVAEFAYRRAVKILPSYLLVIVVLVAAGVAQFASPADAVRQIGLHLLFVHTWFDDSYGSIDGVLWSLAIEVQFYVIFPLVCRAALRAPWLTFGVLALVANVYRFVVWHAYDAVHLSNQLPATLDLFGAGMAAAFAFRAVAVRAPRWAARKSLWTLVACIGAYAAWGAVQAYFAARVDADWPQAFVPVGRPWLAVSFFAIALGALFAFRPVQYVLANPLLAFLSVVSYNLYLWHQAVARKLFAAHIPPWRTASEHDDPAWALSFTVVAMLAGLAVASIATFALERPLLRMRPPRLRQVSARDIRSASDRPSPSAIVTTASDAESANAATNASSL